MRIRHFSLFPRYIGMRKNMEKGKDRASKLFFSDPDRAKDLVSLVLRMRGIKAELTGLAMEIGRASCRERV